MRTESKIGVVLLATSISLKHFITIPEFLSGFLLGVSIVFLIVGLIPESYYLKVKTKQAILSKMIKHK